MPGNLHFNGFLNYNLKNLWEAGFQVLGVVSSGNWLCDSGVHSVGSVRARGPLGRPILCVLPSASGRQATSGEGISQCLRRRESGSLSGWLRGRPLAPAASGPWPPAQAQGEPGSRKPVPPALSGHGREAASRGQQRSSSGREARHSKGLCSAAGAAGLQEQVELVAKGDRAVTRRASDLHE